MNIFFVEIEMFTKYLDEYFCFCYWSSNSKEKVECTDKQYDLG